MRADGSWNMGNVAESKSSLQGELVRAAPPPAPDVSALLAQTDAADAPHPAYQALMASLGSVNSQRTYRGHLRKAAQLLCERAPELRARYLGTDDQGRARLMNRDLAARLPWHRLRMDTVLWLKDQAGVRDGAAAHVANPASVNGLIHALRGIAREAFRLNLMNGDDYERIRLVPLVRYTRLQGGRSVSPGELTHLVQALLADPAPAAVRDTAMLALLYAGGVRRAELAGLTLADIRNDELGPHLRVLGKGNRERRVFLEPGAQAALVDWLEQRGEQPGALFCRILKGGRLMLPTDPQLSVQPLSTQAVYDVVRKRARAAGLEGPVSPHDFRRTLLTHLLQRGRDVFTVQAIAGHADPSTTQRYDRRGEEHVREAAHEVHFPYGGRERDSLR